jgi:predicted AAA+ superfamily ATPase
MLTINEDDIRRRLARDNPWWKNPQTSIPEARFQRRVYFKPFKSLALQTNVRRATVLLGPRRVGKTVMIKQLIADLVETGFDPQCILFAGIDTPVYSTISLEKFLSFMPSSLDDTAPKVVIFDEIQYLRDWERHMKDLVDQYPMIKFIATGSAAAALRLKSRESGAGRFSEFMLPPLTFYEFLLFLDRDEELIEAGSDYRAKDIEALNDSFIEYLNYGGYPEAVLNPTIRENPDQFIKNDIIDKVLLKDLPVLYGIDDIVALNRLFSFLAYNAGQEASLEKISQQSGLAKPTIKKYIEYLESAFLIIKLTTVDEHCRSVKRERNFKVFLNNPSMRAALFAPVLKEETEKIGHLAESAVFSQWQHSSNFRQLRYARWRNEGEVDIVCLGNTDDRPLWIGEIKWSDRLESKPAEETKGLRSLIDRHDSIFQAFITTRTFTGPIVVSNCRISIEACPTSLHCYRVGRNITSSLTAMPMAGKPSKNEDQIDLFAATDQPAEPETEFI